MRGFLVAFLLGIAGACLHVAWRAGGPAWLLAWPALSAALLALAYVLRAPGLLGKRPDGTRPLWAWLLFGPYLGFTRAICRLARLLPEAPLDEVAPGIWVGRRVVGRELPAELQHVVDLTAELDEPRDVRERARYRCLPTLDATVPDLATFTALVDELAATEGPLFIHCAQGHGRSATLAAALVLRRGLAPDPAAAEALLRRARPGIGLKAAQRELLARFAGSPAPPAERPWELLALGVLAATLVTLRLMGRVVWCKCGSPAPWMSDPLSSHTSQHLFDPYSFTHVLHGVLYFALLWLLLGARAGPRLRLALAVCLESGWELLENSSWIIERYRAATISLDYFGDSVLNSLGDVISCTLGYLLARRLPVWGSLVFVVAVELALLAAIRDNLTLNIVMLVHPSDAIRTWQSGG